MNEQDLHSPFFNPKSVDIPKQFHSFETGEKFCNCVVCNKYLLDPDVEYFIEKAIRNYSTGTKDVIFEYAICSECALSFAESMSAESLKHITDYFHSNTDLMTRWKEFTEAENFNIDDWIKHCIITGKEISTISEYQINTMCRGDQLLFSLMPYSISEEALEIAQALLSKQTKDELDKFSNKYLGPSPDIALLLKDKTPIVFL